MAKQFFWSILLTVVASLFAMATHSGRLWTHFGQDPKHLFRIATGASLSF
jgi:hypothetical protein